MNSFRHAITEDRERQAPYLLFLSKTLCVGIKTYRKLQTVFQSPEEVYNTPVQKLENTGILTKAQLMRFYEPEVRNNIQREYENLLKENIRLICTEDRDYPPKLLQIKDTPPVVFLKGKLPSLNVPCASIIGARECSVYGANVASRLGELFASAKVAVVSGMARGIDSIGQSAAVMAGGYSLAVLGGGADVIYPKESGNLYRRLEQTGGILSEYPPGTAPQPAYFAQRNRLISGLSDAVCVIEAKEKSGTLITVDCALEQGREVYALPGRITDATSFGTNELIRQGAGIISDLDGFLADFLTTYSWDLPAETNKEQKVKLPYPSFLSANEKLVLENIDENSFTTDQLSVKTGIPAYELLGVCVSLCTNLLLKNVGAGRFTATSKGIEIRNVLIAYNG